MTNKVLNFYYGWIIVAVSFFTLFLVIGTHISFGVYHIAILAIQAIGFGFGGAIGAYLGEYFYDQMGTYFIPFSLLLASIILGVSSIWMATLNPLRISRNVFMRRHLKKYF